jgi:hypothetical protein
VKKEVKNMGEKKRFKEPVLIKYAEKLDEVTGNNFGSPGNTVPTSKSKKTKKWKHSG